jgi:hypothetical protein
VPGADDAEVDVGVGGAHGRVGGAIWPGVVGDDLAGVLLGGLVVAEPTRGLNGHRRYLSGFQLAIATGRSVVV